MSCDQVENVMLDSSGHVKVVDFGLACELQGDECPMSPMGSLIYMAPELLSERVGGCHTDWWAVGVLAYELMTGRSPWSSISDKKVIKREIMGTRVMPPSRVSFNAGKFISSLLVHDRKKRLGSKSPSEIRNSAFFKSIDWDATEKLQAPPALVPEAVCTSQADRDAALDMYIKGGNRESKSQATWYAGLEMGVKPPCQTPANSSSRPRGIGN